MGSSNQYYRLERLTFLQYLHYRPQEGIDRIPPGVHATRITELSKSLGLPRRSLLACLGISRTGLNRRLHACVPLSADDAARVLGVESLIGQVQAMVVDGVPDETAGFDAARWLGYWLRQPLPALGGRLPASYCSGLMSPDTSIGG